MYSRQPSLLSRCSVPLAVVSLTALVTLSSGCHLMKKLGFTGAATEPEHTAQAAPIVKKPTPPQIDYSKVRPDELGRIPVIMYHDIGGTPTKHDLGLRRSVADFEKDLDLLYAAGFRPVNMGDVLSGHIDIPAGMSPVVLTFDDARETQFKLIETDKALKVDPDCALGVLQAFHKKHDDWGLKATFFVLPKSKLTMESFGQTGLGDSKLQYLVDNGLEIGNHTTLHKDMSHMSPDQIQEEVGNANNELLAAAPKAKIVVMALPMGKYPRQKANAKYLIDGSYDGKPYSYQGAMLAAFRPIPSPFSKKFNPLHLERIAPADNDPNGLRNWIKKLSEAGGDRYISDGDPETVSYPKSDEALANPEKIKAEGLQVNVYSPFGGAGGSKPILGADDSDAGGQSAEGDTKPGKMDVDAAPDTQSKAPDTQAKTPEEKPVEAAKPITP